MIQLYRGSKHSCCDNLLHCQNQPRKVSSHASQYNIRRPKTFYLELMANRHTGSICFFGLNNFARGIHALWFIYDGLCIMTWWDMTSRCVAILLWLFSLHWTSLCCTESVMLHCVRLHRTYIHRTYQYKRWWTPAEWSANDCLGSSFISFDFNLVISGAAAKQFKFRTRRTYATMWQWQGHRPRKTEKPRQATPYADEPWSLLLRLDKDGELLQTSRSN